MITTVALCGASDDGHTVRISRKFHTGLLEYARRLNAPPGATAPVSALAAIAAETCEPRVVADGSRTVLPASVRVYRGG